jgi:hypothetical protein
MSVLNALMKQNKNGVLKRMTKQIQFFLSHTLVIISPNETIKLKPSQIALKSYITQNQDNEFKFWIFKPHINKLKKIAANIGYILDYNHNDLGSHYEGLLKRIE